MNAMGGAKMKNCVIAVLALSWTFGTAVAADIPVSGNIQAFHAACQDRKSADPNTMNDMLLSMRGLLADNSIHSMGYPFIASLKIGANSTNTVPVDGNVARTVEWTSCVAVPTGSVIAAPFRLVDFPATLIGGIVCDLNDRDCATKLTAKLGITQDSPRYVTIRSVPLDPEKIGEMNAEQVQVLALAEATRSDRIDTAAYRLMSGGTTAISARDEDLTSKGAPRGLITKQLPDPSFATNRDFRQTALLVYVEITEAEKANFQTR
jgi:hypothetical protein